MTVLNRLASALGRRDEVPNQRLAEETAKTNNRAAVKELVENLSNKKRDIQNDCIKVLYEVGERKPQMIAAYAGDFGNLLESKNNRLAWGAMTALDTVVELNPGEVYELLPKVKAAMKVGSVISRDHGVSILTKLSGHEEYAGRCLPLLLEQLKASPDNQFPMYAEMSVHVINDTNKDDFLRIFKSRTPRLSKDSQKKRMEKLVRKLGS